MAIQKGIQKAEWRSIQEAIERANSAKGETLVQGLVTKRDDVKKLIWMKEFGDTPIPVIGFRYQVKIHDTQANGSVMVREYTIVPETPRVGDTVLIAQHYGSRRLPKLIGVVFGKGYVV